MNASIEKNTHSLTRPEIIGYMSVDVSREYHSNLSQLKYLDYVPRGKIHLDLNHGIEKAVKRTTDDNGEKITLLLKFLKNNIHYVTQDEIGWRFITYRRTLISVMCNAFNNTHVKIMASLFNNSIYLCSLETPTEMHNRLSLNGRFCAWGYKFEQYLLSDLPGIHQNIEKPVIENEEFSLFYKACLGDHKLLYGAQIDGLLVTNGTVHPPNTTDFQMNLNYLKQNSYVELKTNRLLENPRQEHNFKYVLTLNIISIKIALK
ncbi:unnamed protein product [Diatraea saccharalis]|uniref:Decapping nuclease n=1 Tax=Diatraea saccharalis TaxID=40085 RepID=A0A9P0G1B4_9NEOP|nr:unnamed protein product [Diatraea saccharalis]